MATLSQRFDVRIRRMQQNTYIYMSWGFILYMYSENYSSLAFKQGLIALKYMYWCFWVVKCTCIYSHAKLTSICNTEWRTRHLYIVYSLLCWLQAEYFQPALTCWSYKVTRPHLCPQHSSPLTPRHDSNALLSNELTEDTLLAALWTDNSSGASVDDTEELCNFTHFPSDLNLICYSKTPLHHIDLSPSIGT